MTKLVLSPIANLQNESTVVATINANNTAVINALENTLSRDGTDPNQMTDNLDMNSFQILNLPQATDPTSPVRLQEVGDAPTYAANAAASAASAASHDASSAIHDTNSSNSASAASASATLAQGYVTGLSGTSTTSLTIGTGSKSFTANTGKLWVAGQFVTASSNANSANYMHGSITSYNSSTGALVVNVLDIGGSGTLADWNLTISGTQGPQGNTGSTGPAGPTGISGTPTVNQFATWNNATTIQGVSITGLVKGNGASAPTAAVSGTDYQAPIGTISGIAKGNGANALTAAVSGTDYCPATTGSSVLKASAGGTAATTTSDALTIGTIELGNASDTTLSRASAGVLAVEGVNLTPNIPITSKSVAYTTVLGDANTAIYHPSSDNNARTFTIDSNANVAYPVGTCLTFINDINTVTITLTTDTLVLAGSGSTGSRPPGPALPRGQNSDSAEVCGKRVRMWPSRESCRPGSSRLPW